MNGDGVEDTLERPAPADLTGLRGRIAHALKNLENVPFRALVFVNRHQSQSSNVPGNTNVDAGVSVRAFRLGIALCSAAVAAFLLARLTAWPPHEDETLALLVGRDSLSGVLATVHGERGGAPLHFLLAWLVDQFGGGLAGLRLFSAAFAVASIPVV